MSLYTYTRVSVSLSIIFTDPTIDSKPFTDTHSMAALPHELSDYIVDFLHNDRKSLAACSLTCRSWSPTARYHLYRQVYLSSEPSCRTYFQLLKRSPHLGPFARHLEISKAISKFREDATPDDAQATFWLRLFAAVPNVQTLDLSFLKVESAFHASLVQNFVRTTHLSLQYCRFASFGDFARVLLALGALEHCTLRGVSWEPSSDAFATGTGTAAAAARRSAPLAIKSLVLGRDLDLQVLVEWLLQENLCDALERVSACCAFEGDAVMLGELLRACAPTLQHASLDWYGTSYGGAHQLVELSAEPY